jgi:MFS family permease
MQPERTETVAWFALVNALWISLTVQDTALMTIAVPSAILILAPAHHIAALSLLVGCANLGAMLVPPVAGWISDRARQVGGIRRTFVLTGVAIDICALVGLSQARTLIAFDVLFVAAVASANIAIAAYQAMLPEVVPRASWGAASGLRGAATLIGTVFGLGLAGSIPNVHAVFIVVAGLLALGAISLFFIKEGDAFRPEHATVTRRHDFIVVFVARSFIFFGLALLMTFVLYFFRDVLHVGNPSAGTATVGILSLIGAVALSVLVGIFSDRLPRKYVVAACGIPMTVAALGFAFAPNQSAIFAFAICFGVGLGGMLSAGWALAIDSLPKLSDVARDLGIWGIATNLPNVIAPIVGGWILSSLGGTRLGYQTIFALAGLSFALGSLSVLRIGMATAIVIDRNSPAPQQHR